MTNTKTTTATFPVMGMSCAACANRVDKTLNQQAGVSQAQVNYAAATATVEYDPLVCSPEALQKAVQDAGYDLLVGKEEETAEEAEEIRSQDYQKLKRKTIGAVLLAFPVAVISMFFMVVRYCLEVELEPEVERPLERIAQSVARTFFGVPVFEW